MDEISGIDSSIGSIGSLSGRNKISNPGDFANSFGDLLKGKLAQTNNLLNEASDMVNRYAMGEPMNIHDVMITGEKAGLAFELTSEIRNKAMDAYKEILRMQV